MKIIKRLNKLFCQSSFIVHEPFLPRPERGLLDVLDFEFYCLTRDRGQTDLKIWFHWILLCNGKLSMTMVSKMIDAKMIVFV
jgi:hypothetical protein